MEGSLVAYKVFTNGSVLQASEVNDNLMKQAIAVFSNASARTAAIPSPVEGQTTYREDATYPTLETYDGATYRSLSGSTLLLKQDLTSGSSVQINNVFSSLYDDYLVIISNVKTSSASFAQMRLSVAGTPNSSNEYYITQLYWSGGTLNGVAGLGTGLKLSDTGNTNDTAGHSVFTLTNPAKALPTSQHFNLFANTNATVGSGVHRNSTAYDGINILTGSTFTSGQVKIYGYRNA